MRMDRVLLHEHMARFVSLGDPLRTEWQHPAIQCRRTEVRFSILHETCCSIYLLST
jgi:hypothetical protein